MRSNMSISRKLFVSGNYVFLTLLAVLCLLPLVHVLALSFSSSSAAGTGLVRFWPVDMTLSSYRFVLDKPEFLLSMGVTVKRVLLGASFNMLLIILVAYPLSKETKAFRLRTPLAWYFVFTMLFSGGLIPLYMTVRNTGMLDSLWGLIFPTWGMGTNIFNIVLMLNFFRGLPKELEESGVVDGAGHWTVCWKIIVPLSLPVLATVALFTIVYHWNSWFDGLIFMNRTEHYPLSTYLQTILVQDQLANVNAQDLASLQEVSDRTAKAAQIFIGSLPILLVYPFLQRFFIKGIVMGSVKG
ncbi:carbohydrate ABC transporter permease [Cohnella fermenti]|uniref:Carbohydrate ABC transporter permease n=1 Tax=Cohnella fermenti TaxID=2565925 RepID=A0A4S4BP96_9BACL|nr:carbohydrate ABC transporter permease [Cohnella fermenti]THF76729.1 carbohydrate ABC transporter permease [Cohnella fermenti]